MYIYSKQHHLPKNIMKITKEYIINTHYNGIHPTCKCGCGTELSFKPLKNGPWFAEYTKNHAPKKKHTDETKRKIAESTKKMSIKKFGTENPFQSEVIKEKIRKTNLERYGVDNYTKTDEYRERAKEFTHTEETIRQIKKTNQERYGANSFTASPEGKIVLRNRGFVNYYGSWENYISKLKNNHIICNTTKTEFESNPATPLVFQCETCSNIWEESYVLMPNCLDCQEKIKLSGRSQLEESLFLWLSSIGIEFITNKVFDRKYSLDAYIESHSIGIEMNGLWWHSEEHGQKDRHYHKNKLNYFNEKGIRVINIFEDEWLNKADIIKSKILHILQLSSLPKIHGRSCIVKEIDYKTSSSFLDAHHIQGSVKSKLYLGTYYNNTLIAVMTFSNSKRMSFSKNKKSNEYELVRFASHREYNIRGIASKLLKYFVLNYSPEKIISYADLRFTSPSSNLYTSLGFNLSTITPPNYFYVKGSSRVHRLNFTKQKLVKMGADKNLTEWEIMKQSKYDRIWDCGHLKYEMII
jgi:hypothetical protein